MLKAGLSSLRMLARFFWMKLPPLLSAASEAPGASAQWMGLAELLDEARYSSKPLLEAAMSK